MNSGLKTAMLSGLLAAAVSGTATAAGMAFLASSAGLESGVLTVAEGPAIRSGAWGSELVYFELVPRAGLAQASGTISKTSFREIADAVPVSDETVVAKSPDAGAAGWFKPDGLTGGLAGLALMAFLIGRRSGVR